MSESFSALLDESLDNLDMQPGSIVSGVVLDVDKDWVTVHVGLKSEGVISLDEFRTEVPALSVPEYILIKVNDPTKGSLATLNAKAENFSLASNFIVIFSSVPILVPSFDFRSLGLGK